MKVFLVGAGPGRADLLTLRAAQVLGRADVVLYDRLVSGEVLALVRRGAVLLDVGKQEGEQAEGQERIYRLFEEWGRGPGTLVRLKSGDPMVFGRGGEEWAWLLERGFEVEAVPGVSSALAGPELAGIPLTLRGVAAGFAVATGHAETHWSRYAGVETLVVLMGVRRRAGIARALLDAGRPAAEPVCFVERATTASERIVVTDLEAVAAGSSQVRAPAVMIVGEVVRMRHRLRAVADLAASA